MTISILPGGAGSPTDINNLLALIALIADPDETKKKALELGKLIKDADSKIARNAALEQKAASDRLTAEAAAATAKRIADEFEATRSAKENETLNREKVVTERERQATIREGDATNAEENHRAAVTTKEVELSAREVRVTAREKAVKEQEESVATLQQQLQTKMDRFQQLAAG